jgi:DNA-binding transcriptional LysR family regulator
MQNIPTDLLRTLVSVVDLRSFTKAAQVLGITQPAVSAQIKRLQSLIGHELLDKSAPGVSVTPRGAAVVAQARRLLAINDEILQASNGQVAMQTLRVGIPGDYSGSRIPATLARFRLRWPDIGFTVTSGTSDSMLRALTQGDLDVVMAVTDTPPVMKPRHVWMRQAVWVRSDATRVSSDKPVPLVSYGEDCACQRVAVAALSQAGRKCEYVFTSVSLTSLAAAVSAGFGVLVMPRGRALRNNLYIWDDPPLPQLPQLYCGIYVRDGEARTAADELADYLDADLRPEPQPPNWETGASISQLLVASGS